jgi:hypothetical protein
MVIPANLYYSDDDKRRVRSIIEYKEYRNQFNKLFRTLEAADCFSERTHPISRFGKNSKINHS